MFWNYSEVLARDTWPQRTCSPCFPSVKRSGCLVQKSRPRLSPVPRADHTPAQVYRIVLPCHLLPRAGAAVRDCHLWVNVGCLKIAESGNSIIRKVSSAHETNHVGVNA